MINIKFYQTPFKNIYTKIKNKVLIIEQNNIDIIKFLYESFCCINQNKNFIHEET